MAGYQVNPSGIGVGKRYGNRQVGTVDGVNKTDGSEMEVVIKVNSSDTTGPHSVVVPPTCKVLAIREACKSAWNSTKKLQIYLDSKEITNATTVFNLGTTAGQINDVTLTATAADLQSGSTAKKLTVVPPTDTKGYSDIIVSLVRI